MYASFFFFFFQTTLRYNPEDSHHSLLCFPIGAGNIGIRSVGNVVLSKVSTLTRFRREFYDSKVGL
jgi:hypothetical protein